MKPISKVVIAVACAGLLLWMFVFSGGDNNRVISDIKPRQTENAEIKIIAFGDSLTAGYGLPISDSYPAQLDLALKAKRLSVEVINSGVSGETTKGNLERAPFIRKQNPDIVLLGIGGNDALRLLPLTETKKNILETIRILRDGENPPVVILLRMQGPLSAGLAYKRDFDAIYEDIAETEGVILVPFLTAELFLDSANKLSDGIHYNAVGYRKVVDEYLVPVLVEVIGKLKGR